MTKEPVQLVRDILIQQMGLDPNRIWISGNGNGNKPKDENLFIILEIINRQSFSNVRKYGDDSTGFYEKQSANINELIRVHICSMNTDARSRAYEVQLAMNSTFSEQIQEENSFQISKVGPVINNSFIEETAGLNRFDCDIKLLYAMEKQTYIDYYDTFTAELSLAEQ